jgi:hypothetical protein
MRLSLTAQRSRLLILLASLNNTQWAAPTAAPPWLVKDIALYLLDVDLSWIARNWDRDQPASCPCLLTTKSSSAGWPRATSGGWTAPGC